MEPSPIRNFAIVAHVDHGKSTLADRLLETTGAIDKRHIRPQFLDSNPIERERGITIKLAPVRMEFLWSETESGLKIIAPQSQPQPEPASPRLPGYHHAIFNLIDTPGHVDFSYEVNRSLAACEGAVLLVDATQGVQAQTLAHAKLAQKLGLVIIPAINKIDASSADVPAALGQLSSLLDQNPQNILLVSAKTGQGVTGLIKAVIDRVPPPQITAFPTRALIFNSSYDPHQGVIAWVRVKEGEIATRTPIKFLATQSIATAQEVGIFTPSRKRVSHLSSGEVGYVVTSLKEPSQVSVGDTITVLSPPHQSNQTQLPGYSPITPVVYIGLYPVDGTQLKPLTDALAKLKLSDSSLQYFPESSPALGNGFRVGLLGVLHADIVQERLEREFGLELIASAPSVTYEIDTTTGKIKITSAKDLPDPSTVKSINEPLISLSIFVPQEYLGPIIQLCQSRRATAVNIEYLQKITHLTYLMPFSELIRQFYDQLKSASAGFATLDYEFTGFVPADLVKLDILIAGERIDVLSQIVPRQNVLRIARKMVENLKKAITRHQFEISLQAAIGGKIVAREDIKAFRKDVTAKLYGGDQTRKDKLLEKQKKGKTRLKRVGKINLPQDALLAILKLD